MGVASKRTCARATDQYIACVETGTIIAVVSELYSYSSTRSFGSCEIHGPVLLQLREAIEIVQKGWAGSHDIRPRP